MEARSSSSTDVQSFTPGPHRRSHPNLQHLSLAPLQPKYPITPSDYDAYVDPETSNLHTSSSLSQLTSPSSPLASSQSRSRSANPSSTRLNGLQKRTKKQHRELEPLSITSSAIAGSSTNTTTISFSQSPAAIKPSGSTPWLIQTGLALTSSTAEFKGQTWLAKRESSTALTSPASTPPFRTPDAQPPGEYGFPATTSRPRTPVSSRSRRASRSRGVSRRDLTMTPAAAAEKLIRDHSAAGKSSRSVSRGGSVSGSVVFFRDEGSQGQERKRPSLGDVPGGTKPDWADEETRKEVEREEREKELVGDGIEQDADWKNLDDEDEEVFEYGEVDAELGEGERDDIGTAEERNLREQVRRRGFGIGKWVDGWVDALLKAGDDEDEGIDIVNQQRERRPARNEQDTSDHRSNYANENYGGSGMLKADTANKEDQPPDRPEDSPSESAPQDPTTVWEDVRWLGNLVWDTARS